jgi:hypothetical protein
MTKTSDLTFFSLMKIIHYKGFLLGLNSSAKNHAKSIDGNTLFVSCQKSIMTFPAMILPNPTSCVPAASSSLTLSTFSVHHFTR